MVAASISMSMQMLLNFIFGANKYHIGDLETVSLEPFEYLMLSLIIYDVVEEYLAVEAADG